MEFYNLKFSRNIRFSVEDVEDYNIKGTFDPNSSCDTEFYGYRETTFKVTTVESKDVFAGFEMWLPDSEQIVSDFTELFDDKITLIVQDAIDKQNGEYNE